MKEVSGRVLQRDLAPAVHERLQSSRAENPSKLDLCSAVLEDALKNRASDIHLEPQRAFMQVRFRVDGVIWDVATLSKVQGKVLVNQFKALSNIDPVANFLPKDAHANFENDGTTVSLRVALSPCQFGEAMSIRMLDPRRLERTIDTLGLNQESLDRMRAWVENTSGMFLACGPTGSGKTTTIYALLHELKFANRAIISLEDPVEYEVEGITQVPLDPRHHLNFAEGIKGMLRLDPDFLMLGEIRDAVSASAATNAAISGRILMSTVHARDAVGALTALRNWGLKNHEIAEALSIVVAQRLVRKLCHQCREMERPREDEEAWLRTFQLEIPRHVWRAVGCRKCAGLGYLDRTGIFEFWRLEESDYKLIVNNVDEHGLREKLALQGHRFIYKDGHEKVCQGVTSIAELRRAVAGCTPYIPEGVEEGQAENQVRYSEGLLSVI